MIRTSSCRVLLAARSLVSGFAGAAPLSVPRDVPYFGPITLAVDATDLSTIACCRSARPSRSGRVG